MKLSVIVPVFNLGEYLALSLNNFTKQLSLLPTEQWELIIVDDGSTDKPESIIEPLVIQYPDSIFLLRTENRGVSAARNSGLQMSTGDFVIFADGDDIFAQGMIASLIKIAGKFNPDIFHFEYATITTNENFELPKDTIPDDTIIQAEITDSVTFLNTTNGMAGPPIEWNIWQNMFKREFLINSNLKFAENLPIGEDNIFMWSALLQKPHLVYSAQPLYLYHVRSSSAIHRTDITHLRRMAKARLLYLDHLFDIHKQIVGFHDLSQAVKGIELEIRNVFYRALSDLLLCGISTSDATNLISKYKHNGGEIRIGRPRFNYHPHITYDLPTKLRRWLLAYPISTIFNLR